MKIQITLAVLLLTAALPNLTFAQDPEDVPATRTLVWPDGTRYVGGVLDGKRSGKGTIFWQDGTRFVGQFENDMRNGPGTMILPDGTVYTGFFKDDELVDTEQTIAAANSDETVELGAEESASALGDTELPIEADSLGAESVADSDPRPVDEYDVIEPASEDDEELAMEDNDLHGEDTASDDLAMIEDEDRFGDYSRDVTSVTETVESELIDTIDLWAAAWADKNVPQYLANYAEGFRVPGEQSRRTWEALRRARLSRPRYINIDVTYQRFEYVETNVVDVFFRQAYRSNTYSDLTDKVLRMRKEGTDWKILVERSR